jgi:hypothetical protein
MGGEKNKLALSIDVLGIGNRNRVQARNSGSNATMPGPRIKRFPIDSIK